MALLSALGNPDKVKILGVTTVGGNQKLNLVTQNAGHLLKFCHESLPLVSGQKEPLIHQLQPQPQAHGFTGMDGADLSNYFYPVKGMNAPLFMAQTLANASEPITIVATAPLTNIALLIKTFPKVKNKIKQIIIMGGGIDHGNATKYAEFNIWTDPEAARIVFNSGLKMVIASLDITEKTTISKKQIVSLNEGGRVSQLASKLLTFYQKSGEKYGFIDAPVHDLVAMEYLLAPELFETRKVKIQIALAGERVGQTYLEDDENKPHLLLTKMKEQKFFSILQRALYVLDQK